MTRKQTVGVVLGGAGIVISFGHLALMMIFRTTEPYHGFGTWVMLGLALTVIGVLLLHRGEPR